MNSAILLYLAYKFVDLSAFRLTWDSNFTEENYQLILSSLAWEDLLPFIYSGFRCMLQLSARCTCPQHKGRDSRRAEYNLDDGILTIVTRRDGETIDEHVCS
ncbi:hypothetical protein BV898_03154 [Hypsibius exemplaris]|uniref:Uncharacterized protein n=1 Tax=Hypsibius exemplaris TaxID=2072580 RepID=A0A1W0X6F5_HYPEX|nr:hypothetical protein BV898_03154 [Hypsibius exemplaris]